MSLLGDKTVFHRYLLLLLTSNIQRFELEVTIENYVYAQLQSVPFVIPFSQQAPIKKHAYDQIAHAGIDLASK